MHDNMSNAPVTIPGEVDQEAASKPGYPPPIRAKGRPSSIVTG
jgi:hypothetical protein